MAAGGRAGTPCTDLAKKYGTRLTAGWVPVIELDKGRYWPAGRRRHRCHLAGCLCNFICPCLPAAVDILKKLNPSVVKGDFVDISAELVLYESCV